MLAVILAAATVAIHVDTAHRVQTIRPLRAIGTSVDSDPKGRIALLYAPSRVRLMQSTGLGRLTYRLYTELSIEDWHWNPSGRYSDSAHHQGYWTSSADTAAPISDSFGFRLTHRGDSRDQGDDNDYSRIDDGDGATYWKSDPYLTHTYTHQPDSAHPQWVVAQFLQPQRIDAVRIHWSNPYATRYRVDYWTSTSDPILDQGTGSWRAFRNGSVTHGTGGTAFIKLSPTPVVTNAVRIWMTQSSNTCDTHGSSDPRNCAGYAIEDLGVGRDGARGFVDLVVRTKNGSCEGALVCLPDPKRQTLMWTSSEDPWHRQADKVKGDQDQPGLDVIARSGVTRGLPAIYPVPVFYSTPQNAANEVRYLERRGYPVAYIEMGEEVDGQYALPEDYAELYIQFATAIHAVDPSVKLGGPIFEGVSKDVAVWPNASGDRSWLHRFVSYLTVRGHLDDFAFMSWEHYPYRNCDRGATLHRDLLEEPAFVRRMVAQWRADGVPKNVPLLETEDNFSPDGTGAPQRVYGALWTGDFIGASLESGVSYATFYQAETEPLSYNKRCKSWGAYNPYIVDGAFNVRAKGADYYALQLLTQQWALPGDGPHGVYPVTTNLGISALVTAYTLKRPDGLWSVLVVNKDTVPRRITIDFGASALHFTGTVTGVTFGAAQYHWSGSGPTDRPNPDRGLKRFTASAATSYVVPPQSLTALRGMIGLGSSRATTSRTNRPRIARMRRNIGPR